MIPQQDTPPGPAVVRVAADEGGMRLDRWFRRHFPAVTHGRLERWLRLGQVRIDGRRARAGDRVEPGQSVRVPPGAHASEAEEGGSRSSPHAPSPADTADLKRRVLHVDADVIVLDKPAGLAVQGGTKTARHLDGMLEGLRFGGDRPRLVHRLDKDTSGVLVLARTPSVAAALAEAFRRHEVRKMYWALVAGLPTPPEGVVRLSLEKGSGRHGEAMVPAAAGGAAAVTRYRVLERAGRQVAWVALEPETGRTHQLRVHMAAIGTPILGDGKYGGATARGPLPDRAARLHLHARAIRIPRGGGGFLTVEAPLPPDLKASWDFFGFPEPAPASADGSKKGAGTSTPSGSSSAAKPGTR